MKDIFEKYNEIPFKDFSAVEKKKEAREELASTFADVRTTMYAADRLRLEYERAVNEEQYGMAEDARKSYNSLVKSITNIQEKLKQEIKQYEAVYHERVRISTDRDSDCYFEFLPEDHKIIVT
jgi:hypothetical protein